jgi:hypothetical protein
VQATNTRPRFDVTADGRGTCSHAGVVLLAQLSDRLGLTNELGRRPNLGLRRPGGSHAPDRGAVLRDLVVMLADGGDCLSDLASLRDQPELFGAVLSTPTAWRIPASTPTPPAHPGHGGQDPGLLGAGAAAGRRNRSSPSPRRCAAGCGT